MIAATNALEIRPGVHRWAAYSPAHRVELAAHSVWDEKVLLVFDPIPLAAEVFDWFPGPHAPAAVILTNAHHERDTARWRALFPLAVWAAPDAPLTLIGVRRWDPDAPPFPGWKIVPLPGGAAGETAWFCPAKSLIIFGDAVVNLPGRGLELLPAKYCRDPTLLRESLRQLPEFDHAVFAHGEPILGAAAEKITALL